MSAKSYKEAIRIIGIHSSLSDAEIRIAMSNPSVFVSAHSEEHVLYSVRLLDKSGGNIASIVKAVREITGLGLKESKDLVDSAPTTVIENVSKDIASSSLKLIVSTGALATIKKM